MVCPKCRKMYPDSVGVCPDCNVGLVGVLGDADAKSEDKVRMEKVVIEGNGELSPIVYRTVPENSDYAKKFPLAGVIMSVGIVLVAIGVFFLIKG